MGRKILLVDDDLTAIFGHLMPFEGTGLEIITAQTLMGAEQAYDANRDEIAAIILDGCVPGNTLNSLPFVRKVAADIARESYTGILMAASGSKIFRTMMVEAGCTHEADKPSASEEVKKLLMAMS